jgi:hypothetical protein
MDECAHQETWGVDEKICRFLLMIMLPAPWSCGSIERPRFRAFHALAVDDRRGDGNFAPRLFATGDVEQVVDAVERAVPGLQGEIVVDHRSPGNVL